ncbi:hypothetical protein ACF061_11675 [Streptomyces sp. NPDC015220]|uniref:hypothetical protein n=1 Tax=Streptomyces sp. NPDC015220 TaxID=3364947 RepID=UPI0036FEB283
MPLDVRCKRCGEESLASDSNICWHCLLTDRINKLLAGPDGEIPERLRPLAEAIIGMPRPNSGWAWIHMNRRVPELLRGLSTGDIELSHDALDSLPRSRTIEYLRGLLVAHGCLPWRDEHLIAYGRWLTSKLDTIADIDQRRLIERYTRWHVMRRMRRDDSDQQPSVATILRETGIPAMATRSRAWIQMVREAPPAVLADALGVSPKTAMRYAEQAGTDYLGYANLPRIQKE